MVSPTSWVPLGRLVALDERDLAYTIEARRLPPRPVHRVTKHWPLFRKPIVQPGEGTCVGHGWRHWLEAAPVIQVTGAEEPLPRTIYLEAIKVDEFPQNDWGDMQYGTSVRAGGKILKARGLISEYNMTRDVYTMADWIGGKDENGKFIGGPLVLGVNWYTSFLNPGADGVLHISGRVEGGHCVCLLGWNEKTGYFDGVNSHGIWWGKNGRFKIAAEDMHRLMAEDGEAWTAVEVRQ